MKKILYFSAEWCNPCVTLSPIVEQFKKQVSIDKINIDYDVTLVEKYNIKSIPTLVLLKDGNEIKRHTGVLNYEQLNKFING